MLTTSKLMIAAGMKDINVDTQYMFLEIFAEMKTPNKRSSLRGIGALLTIENKCDRGRLHDQDTAEGWDARFAMEKNARGRVLDPQRSVQIMVDVIMVEGQPQSNVVDTPIYVNACTHGWIHSPYDPPTAEALARDGETKARKGFWTESIGMINDLVQSYRPPVA